MARKPVHRDATAQHLDEDGGKSPDRRREATLIGVGAAVVLLVWFALANTRSVQIDFWVFSRQAPLIVVIVISGLLGAVIGTLVMRRRGKGKVEE